MDIVREALECVHPCNEVGIEVDVEDDNCNYGAEVAATIQKIESNAVLIAELSHQVSLLRQQMCNAPSKTVQRPSSSSSILRRSRSRTPIRNPPTVKSTQTSPSPNSPYVSPSSNSPEQTTPQKSPKIPQQTRPEQTPPEQTPLAKTPPEQTPPATSPAAKTPPGSTVEAKGGDGDTDDNIDVEKLYIAITDGEDNDNKYILFCKFL